MPQLAAAVRGPSLSSALGLTPKVSVAQKGSGAGGRGLRNSRGCDPVEGSGLRPAQRPLPTPPLANWFARELGPFLLLINVISPGGFNRTKALLWPWERSPFSTQAAGLARVAQKIKQVTDR